MKSSYLLPAATALLGFSIAWVAKPGGDRTTDSPSAQVAESGSERAPRKPTTHRDPSDSRRPTEVKASEFPLADQAAKGPQTREEAKMLRLTEALDLSIDQQGAIISLIEEVQATASDAVPVIEDLVIRGKAVEEGMAKLLTPEQFEKFQELRVRERENRTELRAQQTLVQAIAEIDLSPGQREEVLGRLRQKAKADLQSIPASAILLTDKSMLPTAGKELSVEGVLLMAKLEGPVSADDPMAAHAKVINQQRQELEEILRCFDGILTPGQMGQYQAALAENKAIINTPPKRPVEEPEPGQGGSFIEIVPDEDPDEDLDEDLDEDPEEVD
jgi:hypothetical protein